MINHFNLLITGVISLYFLVPVALADNYAGKRILHIDSYHRGNIWNDRIADAVQASLKDTGVTLKIIHMDTKRNASETFKKAAALKAKAVIDRFQPHVVTTSDDNAAKYLIMGHYKNADLPFVFSGLNWDASSYDLPYKNVTGMVEVSPVPQIIELLKQYADGERIGYLTEDTKTKRKELDYHKKLFNIEYDQVYLVKSFAEWKESYLRAQDEVDMLIILGVAALADWDDKEAQSLAENHTKIPSGTDFSWLMHISMLGVGKSPEEQGRWAAHAALKILDGVEPSRIPLTHNTEGKLYFNRRIAASMGIDNVPPLATVVP
jgi:ABC-type uncharacterized transport system substrate-binding protein